MAPKTTDTLGIISIVLDFLALPLLGLILGLIGASKAKKEGYSVTLSRVGWIFGLVSSLVIIPVFITIAVLSYNSSQEAARSTVIRVALNRYKEEKGSYPQVLSDIHTISQQEDISLTDSSGNAYNYSPLSIGCFHNCTGYSLNGVTHSVSSSY